MHARQQLGQVVPLQFGPPPAGPAGIGQGAQWMLLAAAIISGPALIYGAMKMDPPEWLRAGMMIAGVATIGYNVAQFFAAQQTATQRQVREELRQS